MRVGKGCLSTYAFWPVLSFVVDSTLKLPAHTTHEGGGHRVISGNLALRRQTPAGGHVLCPGKQPQRASPLDASLAVAELCLLASGG